MTHTEASAILLTIRAPWTAPAFFSSILLVVGAILVAGFQIVGLPWQAQAFIVAMIVCGLLFSLETALYRLRISEVGLSEYRFGWRHYAWAEVGGWTKWGDGNLLFIRLANGRTIGTDRPGFGDREISSLAELLSAKIGPMALGDQAILPWYLDWTVGGLMRSGSDHVTIDSSGDRVPPVGDGKSSTRSP